MSSLTGKSLNPVMNRRSVIASAAGLGAMSILAGCSSNGGDSGSASGDASFKIGTIGPLTGANASYGKSVTQAVELGCKDFSTKLLTEQKAKPSKQRLMQWQRLLKMPF